MKRCVTIVLLGFSVLLLAWQGVAAELPGIEMKTQMPESAAAATVPVEQSEPPRTAGDAARWLGEHGLRWLLEHGLRIIVILLIVYALHWLIEFLSHRAVGLIARADTRGTDVERENRAKTLVGVFQNAVTIVLYVAGALMILQEIEIPIAPLLGGVAVVGLAVAFGAQSLIKDYFSGFMILMENQYGVNDYVRIGTLTGVVERMTLRITVLRDSDAVHFIPHGQINTVTNLTYRWSRAVFEISVPYQEDVDRVMAVLLDLGKELRADPRFASAILDDPEMLGVESLTDSSVVIKFTIKTRPLKQWAVKYELLRRIKRKFDEMGIRSTSRSG